MSVGLVFSASEVKPRISTNKTESMRNSPPGGANSYQSVQRFGFFRDGRICSNLNGTAQIPKKGIKHSLMRNCFMLLHPQKAKNTGSRPIARGPRAHTA